MRLRTGFLVGAVALALAACSSSGAAPSYGAVNQPGMPAATFAPAGGGGNDGAGGGTGNGSGATAAPGNPAPGGSNGAPDGNAPAGSQVIKTGEIRLMVDDVDVSIDRASIALNGLGGYLAGSDRATASNGGSASVTYRVPAARWEDALKAMRAIGKKVLGEHTTTSDVGGQIVDLGARIDNLRASEHAVQAIMSKANTIGDVLTVQGRLADIQGQIEELSAQLQHLQDQAAFSTLTVVFEVPPAPNATPTPSPTATTAPVAWTVADQAGQASGALVEVGKGAATVAVWLGIFFLPLAVGLVLLAGVGFLFWRRVEAYRGRLRAVPATAAGSSNRPAATPPLGTEPPKA